MSVHISAKKEEIAKTVLQPGDPLRAKFIADHYLTDAKLVSTTRNIFYYTGLYKGEEITVGASGMGVPSIGIYSYELYTEYEVENIVRIGTCGAYTPELKLFDILNVENAASESTYAKFAWEIDEEIISNQGNLFDVISHTGKELSLKTIPTNIHTSDIFTEKVLRCRKLPQNTTALRWKWKLSLCLPMPSSLGKMRPQYLQFPILSQRVNKFLPMKGNVR